MNIQNLFNQFMGQQQPSSDSKSGGINGVGGLAGGAAAGGAMALLIGNKKARKFAGKAATYGGAAVLGGLAFNALRNWQQNSSQNQSQESQSRSGLMNEPPTHLPQALQMTLVKTMISAAHADGHIDETEQSRIFAAMEEMNMDERSKDVVRDLIRYPESPETIARGVATIEQKTEVYLMACFTIDVDTPEERTYLSRLSKALELPVDLTKQLEQQANELAMQAA